MLSTHPSSHSGAISSDQSKASGDRDELPEEPEDILSSFLGVLYDYTAITHSDAGATFSYTYSGLYRGDGICAEKIEEDSACQKLDQIKLTLHTPDTQARNWALHASSIWSSAVFLADHIHTIGLEKFACIPSSRDYTEDATKLEVLELGAGAGLPGLLVAKCLEKIVGDRQKDSKGTREWRVTLSDYPDAMLIECIGRNALRNGFTADEAQPGLFSSEQGSVRVVPYAWGEEISSLLPTQTSNDGCLPGFDLIIAADTLWNSAAHKTFACTLSLLLRRTPDARVHLVAGLHTGRYALSAFIRAIRSLHRSGVSKSIEAKPNARLEVLEIRELSVNGDRKREWDEERPGEDEAERRRWVVWITLGWMDL